MSRQGGIVLGLVVVALACLTVWAVRAGHQEITAGFWFEDLTGEAMNGLASELGGPLTATDLAHIQLIAQSELQKAFGTSRLAISDSRTARYRVRVVRELTAHPRSIVPMAAESRPLPGRRGDGAVNFAVLASSAISYAPRNSSRQTIIDGIGRGVGRSAAHEFAHLILGSYPLHNTTDRLSYEYGDLRPEHFYGDVHWSVAERPLQERIGH